MSDPADPEINEETRRLLVAGQRVFGRFWLEKILGRGGMGVVWKARDEMLEKDVALKFILEAHAQNPDAVAGLKRETRRCQDLRHPGIVAIFDLHHEEDILAVSMEYVQGDTLATQRIWRTTGCFDPADILPWLDQLGAALTYAHNEARVVHRDLKPANIIVTPNGRLKIMDFGISQPLSETLAGTAGLGGGGVTPPYGSPQQLMGESARIADDVYSLGATLYDLLTSRPPFFRGQIDLQVMTVVPPMLSVRRQDLGCSGADIPAEWERIIAACLAKEPKDRPARILDVCQALREGLQAGSATTLPSAIDGEAAAAAEEEEAPVVKIVVPRSENPPTTRPTSEPKPGTKARPSLGVFAPPLAPPEETEFVSLEPGETLRPHAVRRTASNLRTLAMVLILALIVSALLHWVRNSRRHPETAAAPTAIPAATSSGVAPRNPLSAPGNQPRPGEKALDQPARRLNSGSR